MAVRVADKIKQINDADFYLMDAADIQFGTNEDGTPIGLEDKLVEIEEGTASKFNTVNGVTTFRDPFSYKSDDNAKYGSMVLRTPFSVPNINSELSLSIDMSINGDNNLNLSLVDSGKIKSFTKLEDDSGNSKAVYSVSSKLGTHLALTAHIESENKYITTLYSIYRDTLTEIPINISSYFTVMALSEDGTVFAGRTNENIIYIYYKNIDDTYSLIHTITPTLSNVKYLHVAEPTRLTSNGSRQFMMIVGNGDTSPEVYNITSSQVNLTNSYFDTLSGKTTLADSSEDGSTLVIIIAKAAQIYKYNQSLNKYIKIAGSGLSLSDSAILRVNHKGDRFGVTFGKRIMSVTITDTTITDQVALFDSGTNTIYDFMYTRDGGVIITLDNASYDYTINKTADYSVYPSTKLKGLVNSASKIQLSSYSNYGFFIKSYDTNNSYPIIVPIEIIEDIKPSTANPIDIIAYDVIGISEDGYCVAISPISDGPIRIYKKIDNTFVSTALGSSTTNISDILNISVSYNGKYIGVTTDKKCYIYKNNGANVYNEYIVHGADSTDSDPATWTEPRSTIIDNGTDVYIVISDYNNQSNVCYNITNIDTPESVSADNVSSGIITGSNNLLIYVDNDDNSIKETEIRSDGIQILSTITNNVNPNRNSIKVQSDNKVLFIDDGPIDTNNPSLACLCVRNANGWDDMITVEFDDIESVSDHKLDISNDNRYIFVSSPNESYIYIYPTHNLGIEPLTRSNVFNCQSILTDLNVTHDGIIANSSVYPYIYLLNIDESEGSINISFDGNIYKNNLGMLALKDSKISHDNSEFISDIGISFDTSNNGEIGLVIVPRNIIDWRTNDIHINKVTIFNDIETVAVDTDYYNYSIDFVDFNNTSWTYPTFIENSKNRYKDIIIDGSATLNGNNIVTLTKVPNVVVSIYNWMSESVDSGTIYRYRIYDHRITVQSIVNIDINDIRSMDIANEASIYGSTVEGDGFVDIFAVEIPKGIITLTLNIYK